MYINQHKLSRRRCSKITINKEQRKMINGQRGAEKLETTNEKKQ